MDSSTLQAADMGSIEDGPLGNLKLPRRIRVTYIGTQVTFVHSRTTWECHLCKIANKCVIVAQNSTIYCVRILHGMYYPEQDALGRLQ